METQYIIIQKTRMLRTSSDKKWWAQRVGAATLLGGVCVGAVCCFKVAKVGEYIVRTGLMV